MDTKDIKKPRKKRLTHKEKGFVLDVAKGENGTNAALNNYDTDNPVVAASIAYENLNKPHIIAALRDSFPDDLLRTVHTSLLKASHLENMSFPPGPRTNADKRGWIDKRNKVKRIDEELNIVDDPDDEAEDIVSESEEDSEIELMSDQDIIEMISEMNCVVKRIVHRWGGRDVYYFAADNTARDKALDKAYKIRGEYAAEKHEIAGPNGEPLFNAEHKRKSDAALEDLIG